MWVAFTIMKKGDKWFMCDEWKIYSIEEPVDADYYVWDGDYPEIWHQGMGRLKQSYYSGWEIYPQWYFDPEKYSRGEKCFVKFDPRKDPYFQSANRRMHIRDMLANRIPNDTEHKIIRLVLLEICEKLVEKGILDEIPEALEDWTATIETVKQYFEKGDHSLEYIGDENLMQLHEPKLPYYNDGEKNERSEFLIRRNFYRKLKNEHAKRQRSNPKTPVRKGYLIVQNEERREKRGKQKTEASSVQGPSSNERP